MSKHRISATELKRQHTKACFARAFPCSRAERNSAHQRLLRFESELQELSKAQRQHLEDTGFAGTRVHYRFSFEVARWLARASPGSVTIDWSELNDCEQFDDLLRQILCPSEDEYFDSGCVDSKDWVELASAGFDGTDFDWLMAQLKRKRFEAIWRQLYDAAEIPLAWDLAGSRYSISRNVFPAAQLNTRENGMRPRPRHTKMEIRRPLAKIPRLDRRSGTAMINVAMASLAARHRETYHFNFANPDEVYLADVGKGISIAVFGLQAEHRFPLECTMGFLILSNGVPIGYGGSSLMFKQVNTGINIFDDYRGSEASFLWVQVMRVYHNMVGCTRFVANPYQLGHSNPEALQSGAFWFYYHLGYRPVSRDIKKLAADEVVKRHLDPGYRTAIRILTKLSSCDMHLTLPGALQSEFFDEEWLITLSKLATEAIGRVDGKTRQESLDKLMAGVAEDLGIRSLDSWGKDERRSLVAMAPFIAAIIPRSWSGAARQTVIKLLRVKGGNHELDYARRLCSDDQLLARFRSICRNAAI